MRRFRTHNTLSIRRTAYRKNFRKNTKNSVPSFPYVIWLRKQKGFYLPQIGNEDQAIANQTKIVVLYAGSATVHPFGDRSVQVHKAVVGKKRCTVMLTLTTDSQS